MPSTYYLMSALLIVLIAVFHLSAGRMAINRTGLVGKQRRRLLALVIIAALTLDLPLAYLFLFYKFYHPAFLDNALHAVETPFVVLHANAAVFTLIMFATAVTRWFRKHHRVAMNKPLVPIRVVAEHEHSRRLFVRNSLIALGTGALATTRTLTALAETKQYQLDRVVIKIPRLPEELKGTTIAMIADVHSSVFMDREEMEMYKKAVMGLRADMIFIVGDFVNSKVFEVYPFGEAFSGITAPHGVWGVTGNHDYYTGDIETVCKEVEQAGVKLLRNSNVPITKNGKTLWLMGVDDRDLYDVKPYLLNGKTERGTIENMLKGVNENDVKISLCHKPYPFEEYSQLGVDLVVSGHTHGGQVVIAKLDNVNVTFAALASRYVSGLYKGYTRPKSQLYVTRGIGTVGIPVRLNCPPEITHITLV